MYLPRGLISHLYAHLLRTNHPLSPPVLILPALEPDALCACRILTTLLKRDYIPHKIQPVSGYVDLAKAGEDLVRPMKTTEGGSGGVVICLGVGGLVDLSSLLGLESEDPEEDGTGSVEVWVLDARRPWNLTNVFGGYYAIPATQHAEVNPPRKIAGLDKGRIQKSYKPGRGGVIVFDDGDISDELAQERDAYCALEEMPEVDDGDNEESDIDDDDDDNDADMNPGSEDSTGSKKRKSWSDHDDDNNDSDDADSRPRQRRRSNSGSSISTGGGRSPSPTHSLPREKLRSPAAPSAKQLRKKLLALRRSHESVLERYYSLGTSYSEPISSLAYSLASELGREDNDLLWLAIVGVTSLELSGHTSTGLGTSHDATRNQELHHRQRHQTWRVSRSSRTYALLRDEVRRLNPPPHDQSPLLNAVGTTSSPSDSSIRLSPDPRFMLLRHWSLYESMLHSPYLAARLHIWNEAGTKRLHKLLAKMGFSLTQCKQGYIHMNMELRKSLREKLLKYAGVYGLDDLVPVGEGRATYDQEGWGFIRSWGWKAQLSAVDVGVILGAILDVGTQAPRSSSSLMSASSQSTTRSEDVQDRSEALIPRFFAAYDAIAPTHPTQLLSSIPLAQHLLRSIMRTGSSLLAKHQIRHLRAFRMGVVKDGPDLPLFANSPGALIKLALWVGEAVAVNEKDKKGTDAATPLVIGALDEPRGTYLVVGIGGGIGSGEDMELRKEKAEAKAKKQAEREQKTKIREEKRAAKAAERAVRELDGKNDHDEEEDEEEEAEDSADDSDDDDDDDDDAEEHASKLKRGHGRNRFGIAFQEVVEETSARVKIDSFDHCVVEVRKEDLGGFLEGLSLKSVVGR